MRRLGDRHKTPNRTASGGHAGIRIRFPWITPDLTGIIASLFFSAMGANAFVQYVVAYLTEVRGWSSSGATTILIAGFALTPAVRLSYPLVYRLVGHKGSLLLGNVFFVLFLLVLMEADGIWAMAAAAPCLATGAGLLFTAGPLQILDATPGDFHGKVSGVFFTTNFAAWLLAVLLQGAVIARYGYEATPLAALMLTLLGLVGVALVPGSLPRDRRTLSNEKALSGLRDPRVRLVACLMMVSTLAFGLMFGSLAALLTDRVEPAHVSVLIALFYMARIPGSLATGIIADRGKLRELLAASFSVGGVSLATAALAGGLPWLVCAIVALGFQQAAVMVSAMALAARVSDVSARSSAYSPMFAAAELGIAAALLISLLTEKTTADPRSTLFVFAAVFLAAAATVCRASVLSR